MIPIILSIFSADNKAITTSDLQLQAMNRFLRTPWDDPQSRNANARRYRPITDYFHATNPAQLERGNPCTWNGVSCTNERITAVALTRNANDTVVALEWLPPTVEAFHANAVAFLGGVITRRLPRPMRYFCATWCKSVSKTENIALHQLPSKMEEFMYANCWPDGTISIFDLPATMRILYIKSAVNIDAELDIRSLPADMQMLWILPAHKYTTITFKCYNGKLKGNCVQTSGDTDKIMRASKYISTYGKLC